MRIEWTPPAIDGAQPTSMLGRRSMTFASTATATAGTDAQPLQVRLPATRQAVAGTWQRSERSPLRSDR